MFSLMLTLRVFESKAYGKRENKVMNIEGRVQFDLLPILLRNYKLRLELKKQKLYLFCGISYILTM